MMRVKHLDHVFWGILLVLVDININGLDLLPDFVGYGLIAHGCGGLLAGSAQFLTARNTSWAMAAICLVGYVTSGGADMLLGFVAVAVNMAMMWFLLGGLMEVANASNRFDLARRASNQRIAYVVLMGILALLMLLWRQGAWMGVPVAILLVLPVLVLVAMILYLIHQMKPVVAAWGIGSADVVPPTVMASDER